VTPGAPSSIISFDAAASSAYANNGAATLSWNHTVGSGSNGILVVGLGWYDTSSSNNPTVTFNSVPMTASITTGTPSYANWGCGLFYLVSPPSGTYTVQATLTGSAFYAGGGSSSFFGVNQSSPIDATATQTQTSGTSIATSITTVSANDWLVSVNEGSLQSLTGTFLSGLPDYNPLAGGGNNQATMGGHNGPIVTPGAVNGTWNVSSSATMTQCLVGLQP
jgi:hypothetical protein